MDVGMSMVAVPVMGIVMSMEEAEFGQGARVV